MRGHRETLQANTSPKHNIVVIQVEDTILAIEVDEFVRTEEILQKKLNPPLTRVKNISGVSSLSSGESCFILNINDIIQHIAIFISKLWQIHPFGEGNTRTTAVFLIKYLRHLGFYVNNDLFAKHSWYFRNALVRANYNNLSKQVYKTSEYIEKFLRHLLKQEHNELHNREMHIDKAFSLKNEPINNQNEPINEPIKFNTREQSIIALLKENPNIKRHQMAERLACSESTVKRTLHGLIAKGIIRRVGANKNGQWIVEKYSCLTSQH